jgi:hypothetical protein
MPLRTLTDQDGTLWSVWDVMPQIQQVVGLENGWLCFESRSEKRRLSPIPDAWHELDERRLMGLLASARAVKPTPRLSATMEGP